MPEEKTTIKEAVEEASPAINIVFDEKDDGSVVASFPSMNGATPFDVTLTNMHWGLVEDLEQMGGDSAENADILKFFHEYVVGGPRAIPFKHTMFVFEAIRAYIEEVGDTVKNA